MTDLAFLIVSIIEVSPIIAVLGLVFLTLYLPSLTINRLLFHFRRRKGPLMRFLSRPIGPSIPGRGADRRVLGHALKRWAMLGLQTVSFFTALLVIGSGYALFGVAVAGRVEIAYYTVMFTALFAALVSGVECVCLIVRLALHGPRNPAHACWTAYRATSDRHSAVAE